MFSERIGRIDSRVDEILVPVMPRAVPPPPLSPPRLSSVTTSNGHPMKETVTNYCAPPGGHGCVLTASRDILPDRLFEEGHRADVKIYTLSGGIVYAHANIFVSPKSPVFRIWICFRQGTASPVFRVMPKETKRQSNYWILYVRGVPQDAVRAFVRFLYSSWYEEKDMEEFVLHPLVLSLANRVPQLKQHCEDHLVFQLTLLCDASRLRLVCHRMITRNLQDVSATDGWKAMKDSHPFLEKVLIEYSIEENNERTQKENEHKIHLQLYKAMEALIHICRDCCRTIGPHDKALRTDHPPCRGHEFLVRHFASCKLRALGGCIHCRRMWQVLELHSRLRADPDSCRVPLCCNFRDRIRKQNNKKDEKR